MKFAGFMIGIISIILGVSLLLINLWRHRQAQRYRRIQRSPSHDEPKYTRVKKPEPTIGREELSALGFKEKGMQKVQRMSDKQLIVLNVMAKPEQSFTGYEILQAFSAAGMHFGEMNIFHRYKDMNNKTGILFSAASAIEPGTFDLEKLGGFRCTGLSLFMPVSGNYEDMDNFELLLTTATQLSEDLDGLLLDGQRKLLTEEEIDACYDRIQ